MAFKYRKNEVGKVLSADMDKTVVVQVERRVRHRLYGKSIKNIPNFMLMTKTMNVQMEI